MSQMVELGKRNLEAQNNRDEPAALQTAKDLNKKYDELDDVLDDLTSAIKPGVGQKHPHGPQSVDKDIPPHLRRLFAAAKDLERKLPPVVRSGEDAKRNPGEAEKKDFAKALEEIEIPMRGVKAHDSDENKIIALTKVLGDHVDDMGDAAREGNPNGVVSGARFFFFILIFLFYERFSSSSPSPSHLLSPDKALTPKVSLALLLKSLPPVNRTPKRERKSVLSTKNWKNCSLKLLSLLKMCSKTLKISKLGMIWRERKGRWMIC